jgi:hypothetical protein
MPADTNHTPMMAIVMLKVVSTQEVPCSSRLGENTKMKGTM